MRPGSALRRGWEWIVMWTPSRLHFRCSSLANVLMPFTPPLPVIAQRQQSLQRGPFKSPLSPHSFSRNDQIHPSPFSPPRWKIFRGFKAWKINLLSLLWISNQSSLQICQCCLLSGSLYAVTDKVEGERNANTVDIIICLNCQYTAYGVLIKRGAFVLRFQIEI